MNAHRARYLWLAGILLLTVLVYLPGLYGDFMFDDGPNIVRNEYVQITGLDRDSLLQAWSSAPDNARRRPLSMLSFALNHYFFELDPFAFKLTNLIIHLINGLILFSFVTQLMRARNVLGGPRLTDSAVAWLALSTTAVWLLHPVNVSTVLYVVQRMTELSATFVLLALLLYVAGRRMMHEGRAGLPLILAGFGVFLPMGILAKENAALVPLFMLVIEATLFDFSCPTSRQRRVLIGLFVVIVGLPGAVLLGFLVLHPDWLLAGYTHRDFSLSERLMTESRILWTYVVMVFVPPLGSFGFFHDDIVISTSLLSPPTTLLALVAWAAAAVGCIALRKRARLVAFGVLFFLVGHAVESSVIALELMFEHRNYVPIIGPLVAFIFLVQRSGPMREHGRSAAAITGIFVVMLAANAHWEIRAWSSQKELYFHALEQHPRSERAHFGVGTILSQSIEDAEYPRLAVELADEYFEEGARLNRRSARSLFRQVIVRDRWGLEVDSQLIARLQDRLREITPSAENISASDFQELTTNQINGHGSLPSEVYFSISRAALENPALPPVIRAVIYSDLQDYFETRVGDIERALIMGRKAVEAAPGLQMVRERFFDFLLRVQRLGEARSLLAEGRRINEGSKYAPRYRRLEARLAIAQNR